MDSTSESHFHKNASKETLMMKSVISVPLAAEIERPDQGNPGEMIG